MEKQGTDLSKAIGTRLKAQFSILQQMEELHAVTNRLEKEVNSLQSNIERHTPSWSMIKV